MNLSGIAALLALAGIPVTALIARWQMRTALAQAEANHRSALELAEANHRSALELAEANHRSALELAEANHRSALELARNELDSERIRWLSEARRTRYAAYWDTLTRFRNLLLTDPVDQSAVAEAAMALHDQYGAVLQVGPAEVTHVVSAIRQQGARWSVRIPRTHHAAQELWEVEFSPLRAELSAAIRRVYTGDGKFDLR
ncbi:hypothetical protein [Streptomyces sp. NBC_01602]|uniref:hypothetical protein n=1 Tax=Streptomyces sp. NBC_01602 TaxID=2975893 RepID=UPI00386A69EA